MAWWGCVGRSRVARATVLFAWGCVLAGCGRIGFDVASWWDPEWSFRKPVVVSSSHVEGDVERFPVLIAVATDPDLTSLAASDGRDLRFVTPEAEDLAYELERFVPQSGELIAWVSFPALSASTDTTVYMYFGNPAATPPDRARDIWDHRYDLVAYFGDETGDRVTNSASESSEGTRVGTATSAPGRVGSAVQLVADTDHVEFAQGDHLLSGWEEFCVSFWMYLDYASDLDWEANGEPTVWHKNTPVRIYRTPDDDPGRGRFQADIPFRTTTSFQHHTVDRQRWNHVVLTYDRSAYRGYVDGALEFSESVPRDQLIDGEQSFGLGGDQGRSIHGMFDEFRLGRSACDASWVAAEYRGMSAPQDFVEISALEMFGQSAP